MTNGMISKKVNHGVSAMILAAGRGRRMGDMTNHTPKPLIKVNGKSLIEWQIERLVAAGVTSIVINVAYLAELIVYEVDFGKRWGINICYLYESLDAYDTGGGIIRALPWLSDPFIVVNADVMTDYNFSHIIRYSQTMESLAHLILVPNPKHNLKGDFCLDGQNNIVNKIDKGESYTYTGISLCQKSLFANTYAGEKISLPAIWQSFIEQKVISGEVFHANWCDVGTSERWQEVSNGY